MIEKHLNLFFPEWQGYAEDNSVQSGATILKNHLQSRTFVEIEVPKEESLPTKNQIIGYEANLRQLRKSREILATQNPDSTFMIGGTCASEIGPVSYLNDLYKSDLAVLWFDAHGDLNTPESSPSKHFHGMPLRTLLGDSDKEVLKETFSTLKPAQVYVLGGREFDEDERVYIKESGLHHFTPASLQNPEDLVASIKNLGLKNLYVHVDLDVLEPKEFPHMLLPIDKGVGVENLIQTLKALSSEFNVVGSSIVEYVPKGAGDLETIDRIIGALGV